jgi:hypothetical protein
MLPNAPISPSLANSIASDLDIKMAAMRAVHLGGHAGLHPDLFGERADDKRRKEVRPRAIRTGHLHTPTPHTEYGIRGMGERRGGATGDRQCCARRARRARRPLAGGPPHPRRRAAGFAAPQLPIAPSFSDRCICSEFTAKFPVLIELPVGAGFRSRLPRSLPSILIIAIYITLLPN